MGPKQVKLRKVVEVMDCPSLPPAFLEVHCVERWNSRKSLNLRNGILDLLWNLLTA